jgi:hypothetical protein
LVVHKETVKMNSAFYGSFVVLWVLVVGQSLLLLTLLREIGRIYLSDTSALQRDGIALGRRLPPIKVNTRRGDSTLDAFLRSRLNIVMIASDGCGVCGPTADVVRRWASRSTDINGVVLLNAKKLGVWGDVSGLDVVLVSAEDVKSQLEVRATPFVFVTDADGAILAKGLVNTHRHVKQLLRDARDRLNADEVRTSAQGVGLVAVASERGA